jgi:hypothetical protein
MPAVIASVGLQISHAAARVEVDEGLDPDVLEAQAVAGTAALGGYAGLAQQLDGRIQRGDAEPGADRLARRLHGALDVARRHVRGAQQRDEQRGDVMGVGLSAREGLRGALHRAVAGDELDLVVDPAVDLVRVVAERRGARADVGIERRVRRRGEVFRRGKHQRAGTHAEPGCRRAGRPVLGRRGRALQARCPREGRRDAKRRGP